MLPNVSLIQLPVRRIRTVLTVTNLQTMITCDTFTSCSKLGYSMFTCLCFIGLVLATIMLSSELLC